MTWNRDNHSAIDILFYIWSWYQHGIKFSATAGSVNITGALYTWPIDASHPRIHFCKCSMKQLTSLDIVYKINKTPVLTLIISNFQKKRTFYSIWTYMSVFYIEICCESVFSPQYKHVWELFYHRIHNASMWIIKSFFIIILIKQQQQQQDLPFFQRKFVFNRRIQAKSNQWKYDSQNS